MSARFWFGFDCVWIGWNLSGLLYDDNSGAAAALRLFLIAAFVAMAAYWWHRLREPA